MLTVFWAVGFEVEAATSTGPPACFFLGGIARGRGVEQSMTLLSFKI